MADLCVYWIRRANEALDHCTEEDPLKGRAGLVGTQNIRSNASRIGGLDQVSKSGTVIEAVESQPWSGEANVDVSIVNWVKTQEKSLLPQRRRLWFKAAQEPGAKRRTRGTGSAAKVYDLDMQEVSFISSSLSSKFDVSGALPLSVNNGYCHTGQYPRHNEGFTVSIAAGEALRAADLDNEKVVWPFAGGDELLSIGKVKRYVIDFQVRTIVEAQAFQKPFQHVLQQVLPHVKALAAIEQQATGKSTGQDQNWLSSWWQHFRPRPELIGKIGQLSRFMVCSRVTKRPIFMFVSPKVRPGDSLSCFTLEDDYSFGILQASTHQQWFIVKGSKLTARLRYTPESVFDTLPWPQAPSTKQVQSVAEAAIHLRNVQHAATAAAKGGLRALYRTLDLPGKSPLKDAHAALDNAVLEAYGFSSKKDLLQQLMALNQEVSEAIKAGKSVVGPGIPPSYKSKNPLVSADCLGG